MHAQGLVANGLYTWQMQKSVKSVANKCRHMQNIRQAGVHIECNPSPFGHMVALDKTNVNPTVVATLWEPVEKSCQFDVVFSRIS